MKYILLLALLFAVVLSQRLTPPSGAPTQFTADFVMTHPLMSGGVLNGKVSYQFANGGSGMIKFEYPNKNYQEVYKYNSLNGYGTGGSGERPFSGQWGYKWGSTCTCETAPIDAAMPVFWALTSDYTSGGSTTINGVTCTRYVATTNVRSDVSEFCLTSDNKVVRFTYEDLRTFTLSNFVATNVAASVFDTPSGCKCGKPIDIVFVLDRSASISKGEFNQEKGFLVNFTKMFTVGPQDMNLAIINFRSTGFVHNTFAEGSTQANVDTALGSLLCCVHGALGADECTSCSTCGCGTNIAGGIKVGGEEMAKGRVQAAHIFITLTDGYANRNSDGSSCSDCVVDITRQINNAKAQTPDTVFYSVGVGLDRDFRENELLAIADGKSDQVIRYQDWDSLANGFLDLVARACQDTLNPCGGCCGFCTCGQCLAPDDCVSSSFCRNSSLNGVCCRETPRDCTESNRCNTYTCDEASTSCIATPIPCRQNTSCISYPCDPQTGTCVPTQIPNCNTTEPECVVSADCDDGSLCTTDECISDKCVWTPVNCDDSNYCTLDTCDPLAGCVNTDYPENFCDDNSNCTVDSCDPAVGCVFQEVICPTPNNCTNATCDPFFGCQEYPRVCPKNSDDECYLYFCDNGDCISRFANCSAPLEVIIPTLTVGAIIGIVIGIVVVVALCAGGGAFAYTQMAGGGALAAPMNNPLYAGGSNEVSNPIYKS